MEKIFLLFLCDNQCLNGQNNYLKIRCQKKKENRKKNNHSFYSCVVIRNN